MNICVFAESIAHNPASNANAVRGMLRCLMKLRASDTFNLVVPKGSKSSPVLAEFLNSCNSGNWQVSYLNRHRRVANVLGLLNVRSYINLKQQADFYLNLDYNYIGRRAWPALYTVYDIVGVREPHWCSMPWHGARLRQFALKLLAESDIPVVATSDFTRNDLISYSERFRHRTTVIHCGIDDVWFDSEPKEDDHGVEKFGVTKPYWVWYGYITTRKNVDGLVRAYARFMADYPEKSRIPNLVLVGTLGQDSKNLPTLIRESNMESRIRMMPPQPPEPDKLICLVRNSCGLVFPSHYEGFGLPAAEALALGKPVLVSNRTSQPEVVGSHGILCDPNSVESLCDGMSKLLSPEQLSDEAACARKQWARRYRHETAAQKYSELINRLTAGSRL